MTKMVHTPTPDDVHLRLAAQGDPVAFFTLFCPLLDKTRAALRADGLSAEQANNETLRLASRIYREFRGVTSGQNVEQWYMTRTRRRGVVVHGPTGDGKPVEERLSQSEPSELNVFHDKLELLLQREYSLRKRTHGVKGIVGTYSKSRRLSWPVISALTVAVCVLGIYGVLMLSGTRLTITLDLSDGRSASVSLGYSKKILPVDEHSIRSVTAVGSSAASVPALSDSASRPVFPTGTVAPRQAAPVPTPRVGTETTAPIRRPSTLTTNSGPAGDVSLSPRSVSVTVSSTESSLTAGGATSLTRRNRTPEVPSAANGGVPSIPDIKSIPSEGTTGAEGSSEIGQP